MNQLTLSSFPVESTTVPYSHGTKAKDGSRTADQKIARLVFISDTRGKHRHLELPPGDILVHSGSFTDVETGPDLLVQLLDFIAWINSVCAPKFKRIILVPGERDWLLDPALERCSYFTSGSRSKDPAMARLLMSTELPANCTYLNGYDKFIAFVPTRPGGPCIRIAASSISPWFKRKKKKRFQHPKFSAFRWQNELMDIGSTVTHDRYKTRNKSAVWSSEKTQLRSSPRENSARNRQFVESGEELLVEKFSATGEYTWVKSKTKPSAGFIKTKNIHTRPFDLFAHWKKVLLIDYPSQNMKIDILVSQCSAVGVLDGAHAPGCPALCKALNENPCARPRFALVSGSDKGHPIFRDMCCTYSKSQSGITWFNNAMATLSASARGGTIFVTACQTSSLPKALTYKAAMCSHARSALDAKHIVSKGRQTCPKINCDMAHSFEEGAPAPRTPHLHSCNRKFTSLHCTRDTFCLYHSQS